MRYDPIAADLKDRGRIGHRNTERPADRGNPVGGRHRKPQLSDKSVDRIDRQPTSLEANVSLILAGPYDTCRTDDQIAVGIGRGDVHRDRIFRMGHRPAVDRLKHRRSIGDRNAERLCGGGNSVVGRDRDPEIADETVDRVDYQAVVYQFNRGLVLAGTQQLGRVDDRIAVGIAGGHVQADCVLRVRHDLVADWRQHGGMVGHRHDEPAVDRRNTVAGGHRDPHIAGVTVGRVDRQEIIYQAQHRIALLQPGRIVHVVTVDIVGR